MKHIVVNCEKLQTRVALVEDGKIQEYYIERTGRSRVVGSIYKGRIRNLEASLQAAFVDIGLEKNAFLHYWDMGPTKYETWEDDEEGESDDAAGGEAAGETNAGPGDRPQREQRQPRHQRDQRSPRQRPDEDQRSETNAGDGNGAASDEANTRPPRVEASRDQAEPRPQRPAPVVSRQAPAPPRNPAPLPSVTDTNNPKGGLKERIKSFFLRRVSEDVGRSPQPVETPATEPAASGEGSQGERRPRPDNRPDQRRQPQGAPVAAGQNTPPPQQQQRRPPPPRRRPVRTIDVDEIPNLFQVNSEVVVQVSKGMIGEKGPRVTTNLSIPGRYLVLLPNSDHRGISKRIEDRRERQRLRKIIQGLDLPKGMGLICRTASVGMDAEALGEDIAVLLEKWQAAEHAKARRAPICIYQEPDLLERSIRDMLAEVIDEIVVDNKEAYQRTLDYVKRVEKKHRPRVKHYDSPTPVFQHYRLDEQVMSIFRRKVQLPSGAEICIDETEALIAIDVNSSRSHGGKDHPETILNTNLEAAEEVARQLRLRNVGGLVVVDLIDMRNPKDQLKVYRKMQEAVARDRAKTRLLPISRFGLMEMTRQREHESLQDAIYENCPYCRGTGVVKSSVSISVEIQRRLQEVMRKATEPAPIRVTVHPRVLQRLKSEDSEILHAMEHEYGGDLSFRPDPNLHQEEFHLLDSQTGKEI